MWPFRSKLERQYEDLEAANTKEPETSNHAAQDYNYNVRSLIADLKTARRNFLTASFLGGAGTLSAYLFRDQINTALRRVPWLRKIIDYLPDDPRNYEGLQSVLVASLERFDERRNIRTDGIVSKYEVSRLLYGGQFRYTGLAENQTLVAGVDYPGENIHRFAMIGSRSRHLDRDRNNDRRGDGANVFYKTTWADAVNELLNYQGISDEEIKKWIVWTCKHSFNVVDLDAARLEIVRDPSTKKILNVFYRPQSDFSKKILLRMPKEIDGVACDSIEGNFTVEDRYFPILGDYNNLVLQSGVSPDHDLCVPANLMPLAKIATTNVRFNAKPDDQREFSITMTTDQLAKAIREYFDKDEEAFKSRVDGRAYGRRSEMRDIGGFVMLEDQFMIDLSNYIVSGAASVQEKIQKITDFVQGLRYIGENNRDFDRPPLLTLFNDGSDCNNLTILWASLMAAQELEFAILYCPAAPNTRVAHVLGGVASSDFSPAVANPKSYKGYLYAEVAADKRHFPIGDDCVGRSSLEVMAAQVFKKIDEKWHVAILNDYSVVGNANFKAVEEHAGLDSGRDVESEVASTRRRFFALG